MNNFIFENGTRFLFGVGCVKEYLASFLTAYGSNVLLVTEAAGQASGAAEEVQDLLQRSGKQVVSCYAGPFCPRYDQIQQAARLCRESQACLILGVGGSAVLDSCKAISLAVVCRGDLWKNFGELQGVVDIPPLPIGFVASHLEAGAINGAAGVLHENRCIWRDYPPCDPKFALLDPAYTLKLPHRELICQGFSALSGALEEYLIQSEGMGVSRDLMETLIRGMIQDLRTCRGSPDNEDVRSNLMWRCSLWGSRFFQLGRRFSFPALPAREAAILSSSDWEEYAEALAVLLMALCLRESEQHPEVMSQMAVRIWEIPGKKCSPEAAQASVHAFAEFLRDLKLPAEYTELKPSQQKRLAELQDIGEICTLIPCQEEGRDGCARVS